jgi:putative transposase
MPGQRNRFSEAQIRGFLREAAGGTPIVELCWNHCFSRSTFRLWKAKYGATADDTIGRMTRFATGSARLPDALAGTHPRRVGAREQV